MNTVKFLTKLYSSMTMTLERKKKEKKGVNVVVIVEREIFKRLLINIVSLYQTN